MSIVNTSANQEEKKLRILFLEITDSILEAEGISLDSPLGKKLKKVVGW